MQTKLDLFVSHSSADHGVTGALCDALSTYGVSHWFSSGKDRTDRGKLWPEEIKNALHSAHHLLLIASEESLRSSYVVEEIQYAISAKKSIYILSIMPEAETNRLLDQTFPQLKGSVQIHYACPLERTNGRDLFDESAKEIATLLNSRQSAVHLKKLAVTCVLALFFVYALTLAGNASKAVGSVAKWFKAAPVPVQAQGDMAANTARSSSEKSPLAVNRIEPRKNERPAAPPPVVERPFQLPRFAQASIPLRSRLVGSWSVDNRDVKMSFMLRYQSGNLSGEVTVHSKNGGEGCQFSVQSQKLVENYIKLTPSRSNGNCSAKVFHIGYRSEEQIQILVEGGSLNSTSLNREI